MGDEVPLGLLFGILILLLVLSAFFASTETALMSLNRYRLRHLARSGHGPARLAEKLLQRPDRLIGLILLGNNAVNMGAAALATVIALRIGGEGAILIGTLILTMVVFIFCDLAPKTIAALNPIRFALPAAVVYYPLLKIAYPVVWAITAVANVLLRLLGVRPDQIASHSLSAEELRTVVAETGVMVPRRHQRMLLNILDLDAVTVDDVMVPRQEIVGLDLNRDWNENLSLIQDSQHTRLPVYREDIDNIVGVVPILQLLPELARGTLTEARLLERMREPYFVPEGTPLNKQLLNFQQHKRRSAFVVDEYGDVQGLITTQDIIREIVGELGTDPTPVDLGITQESDRSYVVDASANVRQLNRLMNWNLPTDGPKTLNGLIVEQLETIPESGTGVTVADYPIEILDASEHGIKKVRVFAPGSRPPPKVHAA
ncbi:MAG TPA: HlyC/CorC family transporter [Gammaproteobacteria bacterium]|nr:HlyC/CorC family transporter [Gammaproteobacteria bacterium]